MALSKAELSHVEVKNHATGEVTVFDLRPTIDDRLIGGFFSGRLSKKDIPPEFGIVEGVGDYSLTLNGHTPRDRKENSASSESETQDEGVARTTFSPAADTSR
jgi:hypothetical protein